MVQDGENILAGTTNDPWLRGVRTYLQARLHTARRLLVYICCSMHTIRDHRETPKYHTAQFLHCMLSAVGVLRHWYMNTNILLTRASERQAGTRMQDVTLHLAPVQAHAYNSSTSAALWEALSSALGRNVGAWMEGWTYRAGYPLLEVTLGGLSNSDVFLVQVRPQMAVVNQALFALSKTSCMDGGFQEQLPHSLTL